MSLLGDLMGKIFHAKAAPPPPPAAAPATPSAPTQVQPTPNVDIDSILSGMAWRKGQSLDWRHSIVDLMKLLDMDSSLAARRELARELHYDGDWNDTAAMNIWLHKQVMQKVAAGGGKVPPELLH